MGSQTLAVTNASVQAESFLAGIPPSQWWQFAPETRYRLLITEQSKSRCVIAFLPAVSGKLVDLEGEYRRRGHAHICKASVASCTSIFSPDGFARSRPRESLRQWPLACMFYECRRLTTVCKCLSSVLIDSVSSASDFLASL